MTAVQEKFSLRLPEYPGTACCVRIGGSADTAAGASNRGESQGGSDVAAMRQNYDKGGLAEEDAPADPMQMFDRWAQNVRTCVLLAVQASWAEAVPAKPGR